MDLVPVFQGLGDGLIGGEGRHGLRLQNVGEGQVRPVGVAQDGVQLLKGGIEFGFGLLEGFLRLGQGRLDRLQVGLGPLQPGGVARRLGAADLGADLGLQRPVEGHALLPEGRRVPAPEVGKGRGGHLLGELVLPGLLISGGLALGEGAAEGVVGGPHAGGQGQLRLAKALGGQGAAALVPHPVDEFRQSLCAAARRGGRRAVGDGLL